MTVPCGRCHHVRANHGKWWPDRDATPCRVRGCACPGFAEYCQGRHDLVLNADGSVSCWRCDWNLPAPDQVEEDMGYTRRREGW